jgi:FtsH-binding integral membrane protein
MPTYQDLGFGQGAALVGDRRSAVFGQVMGLVAVSLGFAALGAYIERNNYANSYFLFFIAAIACMFGLQYASARGREQLAVGLLFGMALLLGMAVSTVIVYYSKTDAPAVYQAAGATALFVGGLGSYGYSTRRDLSRWMKPVFTAFWIVFAFGIIALFIAIPSSNIIYCVLMLAVFGAFTVFNFNSLARSGQYQSPVPIAAAIFLNIFNVFILMLSLFGGGGGSRR